jgi:hypothetical protein
VSVAYTCCQAQAFAYGASAIRAFRREERAGGGERRGGTRTVERAARIRLAFCLSSRTPTCFMSYSVAHHAVLTQTG